MGKLSIGHCSLLMVRVAAFARLTIGGISRQKVLFHSTLRNLRNLPGKEWSDQEAEKLRDLVQQHPSIYLVPNLEAEFPGRTRNDVLWKLVEKRSKRVPWSAEEDQIIKNSRFAGEAWVSIQKKIPHRNVQQVSRRFNTLMAPKRVRPPGPWVENSGKLWSSEEVAELIRVRDDDRLSWDGIAKLFGRSHNSIIKAYTKNHVPFERPWSEKEVCALKELLDAGKTFPEISKILDRTVWSVAKKKRSFWRQWPTGKDSKPVYTQAETAIIEEAMKQGLRAANIMSKFPHRTSYGIRSKMRNLRRNELNKDSERRRGKDAGEKSGRILPPKGGARNHHHWSKTDVTIFEAALDEGLSEQQICSKLPHIPPIIIKNRRTSTKQSHGDPRKWSQEEDAIITRAIRDNMDKAQLRTELPRRTSCAIRDRYLYRKRQIGIEEGTYTVRYSPRWTPDEEAIISEAIQQGLSPKDVKEKLPSRVNFSVPSKWRKMLQSMESSR